MKNAGMDGGRHLRDYWNVVRERKWLAVTCFLLVFGAGALLTYLQDEIFEATTKVQIDVQPPNPLVTIEEGTQPTRSLYFRESYFQTEFETIGSRDLLSAVLQEHQDLGRLPGFSSATDPVGLLSGMLHLSIIPTTDVVAIRARGRDPGACATVANAIAETYVHWKVDHRLEALLKTRESIVKKLEEEYANLRQGTEQAIETARRKGTLTPELQKNLENSQEQRETEINDIESKIQKAEAVLAQVRRAVDDPSQGVSASGMEEVEAVRDLVRSRGAVMEDLKKARSLYKEDHPDVQALEGQLKQVTLELASTLQSHLSTLRSQRTKLLQVLLKDKQMLAETLSKDDPESAGAVLTDARGRLLETLNKRLEEVSVLASQGLLINDAQIIERARPPAVPIRPNVKMNFLVASLLGLLVGLGSVFFLDYLDVSVKTVEDVEKGLGRNVLCSIPARKKKTLPMVRESYQTLRTALIFADKAQPTTTVLFTSATPKEGKSTTVSELARALAAGGGRTIILDCDLRMPTLSHIFKVPRERGLSTYLLDEDEAAWPRHIRAGIEPQLDLFPTGPIPPNPTDILVSPRLTRMFGLLSEAYDWVLVDSPPVTSMSDAVLLADRVDGVVFVTKYDHVDRRTAARALAALDSVGARVLGVVLNAVDASKPGYKDYFYGRYAYYGEARRRKGEEERVLHPVSGGRS